MANVSELLDRFVELFNTGRDEETERDYAPDGYGEEVGTGRRFTPQEGTANARQWREAFPDAHGEITNKIVDGNRGAAEIVWTGTNTGSLNGQAPTNRPATVRAVVVIDTEGGKITRSTHYIDMAGLLAQVGSPAGARSEART